MKYDESSKEFVLSLPDRTLLEVPDTMQRWPLGQWPLLAETVQRSQRRVHAMDETMYPAGSRRNEMVARILAHNEQLAAMRSLIRQHVEVDTSEIDALLKDE